MVVVLVGVWKNRVVGVEKCTEPWYGELGCVDGKLLGSTYWVVGVH